MKIVMKLKKNKKPEPFVPGESIEKTGLAPTTVYERPEVKIMKNTGQKK